MTLSVNQGLLKTVRGGVLIPPEGISWGFTQSAEAAVGLFTVGGALLGLVHAGKLEGAAAAAPRRRRVALPRRRRGPRVAPRRRRQRRRPPSAALAAGAWVQALQGGIRLSCFHPQTNEG